MGARGAYGSLASTADPSPAQSPIPSRGGSGYAHAAPAQSPAGGGEPSEANAIAAGTPGEAEAGAEAGAEALFEGFDFVDPRYICTDEQLQAFQVLLAARLKAANKKRGHKLKK